MESTPADLRVLAWVKAAARARLFGPSKELTDHDGSTRVAVRTARVRRVDSAAVGAGASRAERPLLAPRLPRSAQATARPDRHPLGLRRPRPQRSADRQPERAAPLARVFRQLYALRFPIRHMRLVDVYGPTSSQPADGDLSGSFECRQAVPSPCSGGTGTGSWSEHAYGEAVDLNTIENPYVGCGRTRERSSLPYLNRSRLRPGMVTPAVVQAFRSIGWGWGGNWTGSTKDYMHFSASGH